MEIMSAAVADSRKSIVFYQQSGRGSLSVIQKTTEGCIIACIGISYLETCIFQDLGDFSAGFVFFLRQLRVVGKIQTKSYGFAVMLIESLKNLVF